MQKRTAYKTTIKKSNYYLKIDCLANFKTVTSVYERYNIEQEYLIQMLIHL